MDDEPAMVCVFHGDGARFASGVFCSRDEGTAWVAQHRLTVRARALADIGDAAYHGRGSGRYMATELVRLDPPSVAPSADSTTTSEAIGEYVSCLANSVALAAQDIAYLLWGLADATHDIVGTKYRPDQAKGPGGFPKLARNAARVVDYEGMSWIKTRKEQVGQRGYATGFQGLVSYVADHLPNSEAIQNGIRMDELQFPRLAIRELVANTLIHQDLTVTGAAR